MTTLQQNIKDWLESPVCNHARGTISDVRPVIVQIGDESWNACYYLQWGEYTKDMMACLDGRKKPGARYSRRLIYCVGPLPKVKLKKGKKYPAGNVCFPYQGLDWYVAGYMQSNDLKSPFTEFHPFGENFLLAPWDIPNSKIDDYERTRDGAPRPYKRVPMTITPELPKYERTDDLPASRSR